MYGPGIYLFFKFTRTIAMVFAIMAAISIIPITYNYVEGERFNNVEISAQTILSKMSIASHYGTNPEESSSERITESQRNKLMNAIPDMIVTLIMLAFYLYWSYSSNNIVKKIEKTVRLPHNKAIEVIGFPENATAQEV